MSNQDFYKEQIRDNVAICVRKRQHGLGVRFRGEVHVAF